MTWLIALTPTNGVNEKIIDFSLEEFAWYGKRTIFS